MVRTKKPPPQSAEDVELAKETIAAAFDAAVEQCRAQLRQAEAEVLRLQQVIVDAEERRTAWADSGEIDEDRALDAHSFATRDMHALARRVTSPSACLDPAEVDAARRKHEAVKRYLSDRNLLPAELAHPNWRPW